MSDEVPNFLVVDIEAADEVKSKTEPWKSGVSVICGWGLRDFAPYVWLLDAARFPRVILAEQHFAEVARKYDGIVTWNGTAYDDKVIAKKYPDAWKSLRRRRVDLHPIAALLQAGVDPVKLAVNMPDNWASLAPNIRGDFLGTGWSLDSAGKGTLGIGKLEGPQGAASVTAWKQGRYSEVTSYCIQDVAITRAIYLHAFHSGTITSTERGRVEVPRVVLL